MRTTITLGPKNNPSIRRSDLSRAGVDEGVSNTGLVLPGSVTGHGNEWERQADRLQRAGSDSVGRRPRPVDVDDLQERVPFAFELTKSDWDTARQCLNRRIQAWRALEV